MSCAIGTPAPAACASRAGRAAITAHRAGRCARLQGDRYELDVGANAAAPHFLLWQLLALCQWRGRAAGSILRPGFGSRGDGSLPPCSSRSSYDWLICKSYASWMWNVCSHWFRCPCGRP